MTRSTTTSADCRLCADGSPQTYHPTTLSTTGVHLIGIGGSGMAGLAEYLLRRGARVSGSDMVATLHMARLAEHGARITRQQDAPSIPDDVDVVVASAAIPPEHPEIVEARRRGIEIIKYAEMLGRVMAAADGIAISGTHGKSTTSAWLTYVLRQAGLDPSYVIGATVPQLGGGSGAGAGVHFVAEACEYDRSFLNLHAQRAAILNIEEDHLDYYKDIDDIRAAFATFAGQIAASGLLIMHHDVVRHDVATSARCRVETYGETSAATWALSNVRCERGCYTADVHHDGQMYGRIQAGIPGRHNLDNALAVAALAHDCGVPWDRIQSAVASFKGANRRLELRGQVRGVTILDDYAHHPTEIRVTLEAARARYNPKRLWCVFQPHQHSRTRFLLCDFASAFGQADRVVVPRIYFVRDTERDRQAVCAGDLADAICGNGGSARFVPEFGAIVDLLTRELAPGDVVVTMGAGTIWKVADELVQRLGSHLPE